jgi:hypothetical protein
LEGGQTVLISVATAAGLGLLVVDENGEPVLDPVTNLPLADESQVGQPVEILPGDAIPDETPEEEEPVHPISALLGAFFDEDASVIDGYHQILAGVIAQAPDVGSPDDASLAGIFCLPSRIKITKPSSQTTRSI